MWLKRARDDRRNPERAERGQRDRFAGELPGGVRDGGARRERLAQRVLVGRAGPVDFGRTCEQTARRCAVAIDVAHRFEEPRGPHDVRLVRAHRVVRRVGDERDGGQMVDHARPHGIERRAQVPDIGEIEFDVDAGPVVPAARADHFVTALAQDRNEVASGESVPAGDEDSASVKLRHTSANGRKRSRSALTMRSTNSSKLTCGSQPRMRRALDGSPTRWSTSAGR